MTTAFAPATVANVTCGFDLIGFAIEGIGDRVTAERRDGDGVELKDVTGDGGALPREAERNTAGVAVIELLKRRKSAGEETCGISLRLDKGMPLASGLGSSAASAVAAVVAANALFARPSPRW
ncbi:homoserine kinase, partial [bacterium]|nr:homoserine kinase [bacterium]